MRPITLRMSAFGPYPKEEIIDFTLLGNSGLYLITGDTGAGKTTIFDAITYALFGNASGEDRDNSMFRSKYADLSTPTEVELTFELRELTYTVKRNPDYVRQALRGGGETKQKAAAELTSSSGQIVTGISNVNKEIEELLGVNYNQFTKIVMIAQGAFKRFLFADTKERHDIFRKLFGTQNYESLQLQLKSRLREIEDHLSSHKASMDQYIKNAQCDEDSVLFLNLNDAKQGKLSTEEVLEIIGKIMEADSLKLQNLKKEVDQIDMQIAANNEKIGIAKKIGEIKEAKSRDEEALPGKKLEYLKKKEISGELDKRAPELTEKKQELVLLQNELKDYDTLQEKEQGLFKLEASFLEFGKNYSKKIEQKEILFQELEEKKQNLEEISEKPDQTQVYEAQLTNLLETLEDLESFSKDIREYETVLANQKKAQDAYAKENEKYMAENEQLVFMRKQYMDEQAGIIAKEIKEGEPCPVCGSISHPNLAKVQKDAPTKEELEEKSEEVDRLLQNATKKNSVAASFVGKIQALEAQILDDGKKYLKREIQLEKQEELLIQIAEEISKHKSLEKEKREKISLEKARSQQKSTLETKVKALTQAYEEANQTLQDMEKEKVSKETKIQSEKSNVEELKAKLRFESLRAAKQNFDEKQRAAEELEKQINAAKKELDVAEKAYSEIQNRMSTYEEQLKGAFEIPVEELQKQNLDHVSQKKDMQKESELITGRISMNRNSYDKIKAQIGDVAELEEKCKWVRALSNTANANVSGKERILLETYVQMSYFDRIIGNTNVRLMSMTNGQYELKRREDHSELRSLVGLELDVIDHYNGSIRSVKSLSGGESFKASLAMALGLSDEIQASAGGIQFDTMFIDEGFGSLDEESLQQAMKVLVELGTGNRLVGIISHVNELKEKIEKQIVVTKDKANGSHANIVSC